jgi:hypothetical protein
MTKPTPAPRASTDQAQRNSDARFESREIASSQRRDMASTRRMMIASVIVVGCAIWLVVTW